MKIDSKSYSNLIGEKIPLVGVHKSKNDWTLDVILLELQSIINSMESYYYSDKEVEYVAYIQKKPRACITCDLYYSYPGEGRGICVPELIEMSDEIAFSKICSICKLRDVKIDQ